MAEAQQEEQGQRVSRAVQTTSQLLLLAAGVLYATGFVVVALFDAQYGIADFGLFRTKVIAAGAVLMLVATVPVLIVFRMFNVFGLKVDGPISFTPKGELSEVNKGLNFIDVNLYIPFACSGLLFFFIHILGLPNSGDTKGTPYILLLYLATFIKGYASRNYFNQVGWLITLISVADSFLLFWLFFHYGSRPVFWLLAWMSALSFIALHMARAIQARTEVTKIEWERHLLLYASGFLWIYATHIFPYIRHELGGGAPISVSLHLSRNSSVFNQGEALQLSLIDETEQGYYFLNKKNKALFISRGAVESMDFGQSIDDASAPLNCEGGYIH